MSEWPRYPSEGGGECQVGANCHDDATHFIMVKRLKGNAQRLELCTPHYQLALDMRDASFTALGAHGPLSEEDKLIMKDHTLPIEERRAAFKRHNRKAR